jgi:beta-glucosidase
LGVNYYFPEIVADAPGVGIMSTRVVETKDVERTAFGWEVSPDGMVRLLNRVSRDYRPNEIYITENGSTYDDVVTEAGTIEDIQRRSYLIRHLQATRKIIAMGVPVKGYFAWSLMDNFEWAEGYIRRFGLTHVNFETQQRTLKASGEWYRAFLGGER